MGSQKCSLRYIQLNRNIDIIMPTYVYRREDGSTFEIQQRITEPALEVDPETGQKVERVISGAGLIFKGSGFYLTDYARNNNNAEPGAKASTDTKESKSDSSTAEKTGTSSEKKESPKASTE
jgi:predicted nucleic acid-binding Zn ribbon protein